MLKTHEPGIVLCNVYSCTFWPVASVRVYSLSVCWDACTKPKGSREDKWVWECPADGTYYPATSFIAPVIVCNTLLGSSDKTTPAFEKGGTPLWSFEIYTFYPSLLMHVVKLCHSEKHSCSLKYILGDSLLNIIWWKTWFPFNHHWLHKVTELYTMGSQHFKVHSPLL